MNQEMKPARRGILAKRVAGTAAAFAFMIGAGWCSGLDMLERGNPQAAILMLACSLSGGVWLLSGLLAPRGGQ